MGLRFRRSVKICNGLKLNFGKTGMSMTVGSGPLKKTFNTNGNVTTTVGIPGTGIYWTETERRGTRNNRRTPTTQQMRSPLLAQRSDYQVAPAVDDYFTQSDRVERSSAVSASLTSNTYSLRNDNSPATAAVSPALAEINGLSVEAIKRIYLYEDAPIDWTELIAGATADDLLMDQTIHAYCAQMAPRILSGDIDAYLEVIERMRPVDDLALYSGDFEFGTDSPSYIEVEFCAYPERVLCDGSSDVLLKELISAIAVRVARDLMALLPVSKVLIHVEIDGKTVLSVRFARGELLSKIFKNSHAADIVQIFPHLVARDFRNLVDVGRLSV